MVLGFNKETNRYGILHGDLWVNLGLHCGETFQVMIDDIWFDTRIEYNESIKHSQGWYLVGLKNVLLEQLPVRYGDQE